MKKKSVVVIGAGIVGVSTAIWLRRAGHEVTLIDKGEPGMGASYGNAGVLASCSVVPVTTPGLFWKAPRYLLDPNFPLFIRWRYLPRLVGWLMKYIANANDADTRRIAKGTEVLVANSPEEHLALAKGTPAEKWVEPSTYSFAYKDRAAFEADAYVWKLRREAGFVPDLIEGAAVQKAEPMLGVEIGLLAVMKDHGFIRDPGAYVAALAGVLQDIGGKVVQAEVIDFDLTDGNISAVITDKGSYACDNAVLAMGVWSRALADKLGLNVPLEAERGYHIVFKNPSQMPSQPIMIATGKFVATPMAEGLRCAGIAEFGGTVAGPSKAPFALLRKKVAETFPDLEAESEEEWMGFRPTTADSLPVIGEIGKSGVFAAFGHQHVGLTGGPKTGRIVANLISGIAPNNDMSPYAPKRFAIRA